VARAKRTFAGLLAGVPFVFLITAIPTAGSPNKKANERSAIRWIHAIIVAENMYELKYPANGYSCSLTALGGDPKSGPPSPAAAQLIGLDLASGLKSGYIFRIPTCTKVNVRGKDRITGFSVTAVPQAVGTTGDQSFCSDLSGVVKSDPAGGTNCTATLQ
jgi:type IV pilus assembly protein PilA